MLSNQNRRKYEHIWNGSQLYGIVAVALHCFVEESNDGPFTKFEFYICFSGKETINERHYIKDNQRTQFNAVCSLSLSAVCPNTYR